MSRSAGPDKERERLAALAKETVSATAHAVRPDYFGTAEHKALGQYLESILEGKPVIGKATGDPSHVLLHHANTNGGVPSLSARPIPVGEIRVAGTGSSWLEAIRGSLADALTAYDPNRELYVRSGLTLRYGEVIALAGDYFETPEDLHDELTPAIAAAIRKVTPSSTGTFMLTTHRGWFDYLELANRNQVHFAPRSWVAYARQHGQALKYALDRSYEDALFANAFADHYLSDSFASGHLRVPRDALVGIGGARPSRAMHNEENVNGLWVQDLSGNVWRAYGDDKLGQNPVHTTLAAFAVATSLQRVHRAYRLEGPGASELRKAIDAGLAELPSEVSDDRTSWPAGLWKSPATLPDFLGAVAGLPDIRAHLPVPLAWRETTTPGELANYQPLRWIDSAESAMQKRAVVPQFDGFFKITPV